MIYLKNEEEIELLRENNLLVSRTLAEVGRHIRPGVTTKELDRIGEEFIRSHGAVPAFLGYQGYPASLCISVNEQVVHGLGRKMHEDPGVPNYGARGRGPLLREGMVICIEPMINMGTRAVVFEPDGWTVRTRDRKPAAHYEFAVAVRKGGADVLTDFSIIEEAINK